MRKKNCTSFINFSYCFDPNLILYAILKSGIKLKSTVTHCSKYFILFRFVDHDFETRGGR